VCLSYEQPVLPVKYLFDSSAKSLHNEKKYVYFNDAKVDENVFMHNLIPNF